VWGLIYVQIVRIHAKRAFTPTKIPGADYVINQYIGCQHACMYCYARFMCKWYNYGEWGSWIVVKENLPKLVKKEKVKGEVYMSSVSDPYQPIEKQLELTRAVLQNMDKNIKLGILTKSSMVLRDIDVFKQFKDIEIGLTVNNFNKDIKKEIEPFSSDNKKRLEALKVLHEEGIKNYAFVSPIIPGLTDVEKLIKESRSFTDFYWFEFLNLRASGKQFKQWLKQNWPESYKKVSDKSKIKEYMNKVIDIIRKSNISVRGIVTHYPNFVILK